MILYIEFERRDVHSFLFFVSGLIYVLDSTNTERLIDAKEELESLLDYEDMRGVPVLVIANKQDMQGMGIKTSLSFNAG